MVTKEEFLTAAEQSPPRRAPYTFVPLGDTVVPSPWGKEGPDLGRPHREGICGTLELKWMLEQPMLIGGADNNKPVKFEDRYVIPGPSQRGLFRSFLEAATNAHLDLVDDGLFGIRDFQADTWVKVAMKNADLAHIAVQVQRPDGSWITAKLPFAGWLEKEGEKNYRLTKVEVDYKNIMIDDIVIALGLGNRGDWHCMSLHDRMDALDRAGLSGDINLGKLSAQLDGVKGSLVVAGAIKTAIDERKAGEPITANKVREVAFLDGDVKSWKLSEAAVEAFIAIQPKDGRDQKGAAEENWSYWKPHLDAGRRVPVFFRGDPGLAAVGRGGPDRFFMSLTRFVRIPHTYSVHDIRDKSQNALFDHELDFVQALFGHVPQKDGASSSGKGRERAWRSRVRIGMAVLDEGLVGAEKGVANVVTMKPRASFFPHYLRPVRFSQDIQHPVDWSNSNARVAGRKRYPARGKRLPISEWPCPPASGSSETGNDLIFLHHKDVSGKALTFSSAVRLHNVLPAELGAILFAIDPGRWTAGQPGLRHMIGRAKAFGCGQVRVEIANHKLEANIGGGAAVDLDGCVTAFKEHVAGSVAAFNSLPHVRTLLATCNPEIGVDVAQALRFPEFGSDPDRAKRMLDACQAIKKRASCGNYREGDGRQAPNVGRAGNPVCETVDNVDFLFLPDYPQE